MSHKSRVVGDSVFSFFYFNYLKFFENGFSTFYPYLYFSFNRNGRYVWESTNLDEHFARRIFVSSVESLNMYVCECACYAVLYICVYALDFWVNLYNENVRDGNE